MVGSSAHTAAAADRQESSTPFSNDSHMVSKLLLLLLLLLLRFGFVEVRADFPESDMKTQLLKEFLEEIWVMR